jgi:hypothetical protein
MDITSAVSEMMSRNRGPDPLSPDARTRPNYGITAALEGNNVGIVLTFLAGSAYCCMESDCHLGLFDGKRWDIFRHKLTGHGVDAPPALQLKLSCIIEAGALFFDFSRPDPKRRLWYAFKPATAYEYDLVTVEATSDVEG